MKLNQDKKLMMKLAEKWSVTRTFQILLEDIDQYLEEHGFQIYPTKKEKGTVSVKEVDPTPWRIINIEKGAESFGEYRGRLLYADLVNANGRLICSATIDYILNEFQSRKDIISNYQEAYDALISFSKDVQKYWKGDEEKPSADGEETFLGIKHFIEPKEENTFQLNLDRIDQVVKQPEFTPWMKCPVCDGEGEKEVVVKSSEGMGKYMKPCPCCEGAMVIPMKRETK